MGILASSACDDDDDNPTPTTPPTSSAVIPTIIDEVEEAVRSGAPDQLEALLKFQTIPCISEPQGQGSPPLCGEGEADGAPVEVIVETSCETNFIRRDALNMQGAVNRAVGTDNELRAAYEFAGDAFWPEAVFFVVFERPQPLSNGTGYAVVTTGDGVLGFNYGCGSSPEELLQTPGLGSVVIAPAP
jgi:hypothetical protein